MGPARKGEACVDVYAELGNVGNEGLSQEFWGSMSEGKHLRTFILIPSQ